MPKFQKGHPRLGGRQKGVLTHGQVEVQQLARDLLSDPAYQANLRARLISGKLAPQVECKLYAYAFGEPPQHVQVNGTLRGIVNVVHEHIERVELTPSTPAHVTPKPDVH